VKHVGADSSSGHGCPSRLAEPLNLQLVGITSSGPLPSNLPAVQLTSISFSAPILCCGAIRSPKAVAHQMPPPDVRLQEFLSFSFDEAWLLGRLRTVNSTTDGAPRDLPDGSLDLRDLYFCLSGALGALLSTLAVQWSMRSMPGSGGWQDASTDVQWPIAEGRTACTGK